MNEKDERLGHLLTYTVFHIGIYISLFSALIGIGLFKDFDHWLIRFSTACFLVAGVCGAIVGSNIPEHRDFKSYSAAAIGPWGAPMFNFSTWATMEHLAFWAGVLPLVAGFLIWGPQLFTKSQGEARVLRGSGLEIVDAKGRVRASITLHPADRGADATQQADTVLLRLITELGRPSVKIAASEPASGLSFAGATGTKETWLILEARERTTLLRLRDEAGNERVLTP